MAPKHKKYTEDDLKNAIQKVLAENWSVYKAGKAYNIPWSTLKDRLKITPSLDKLPVVKIGRPFNLSREDELKIVSYVAKMESIGCGLNATEIRRYAFEISKTKDKNHFSKGKAIAGWDWWMRFKERYGLCQSKLE